LCVLGTVNANRRELLEQQSGALDDHTKLSQTNNIGPAKADFAGERAVICRLTQDFLLAESNLSV
jgi:hypothetical protein